MACRSEAWIPPLYICKPLTLESKRDGGNLEFKTKFSEEKERDLVFIIPSLDVNCYEYYLQSPSIDFDGY